MSKQFTARRLTGAAVAGLALLLTGSGTGAAERCRDVRGRYTEQLASGQECTSPVGLCIEGRYTGAITGDFLGAATALITTADTPTTGVALCTSWQDDLQFVTDWQVVPASDQERCDDRATSPRPDPAEPEAGAHRDPRGDIGHAVKRSSPRRDGASCATSNRSATGSTVAGRRWRAAPQSS